MGVFSQSHGGPAFCTLLPVYHPKVSIEATVARFVADSALLLSAVWSPLVLLQQLVVLECLNRFEPVFVYHVIPTVWESVWLCRWGLKPLWCFGPEAVHWPAARKRRNGSNQQRGKLHRSHSQLTPTFNEGFTNEAMSIKTSGFMFSYFALNIFESRRTHCLKTLELRAAVGLGPRFKEWRPPQSACVLCRLTTPLDIWQTMSWFQP